MWTRASPLVRQRLGRRSTSEGARARIQVFVNHKLAQGGFLKSKLTFRFRDVVVLAMLAVGLRVATSAQNSGTVFLVRHAEKLSTARDAILSPQGHKRADCLAHTLGDAGSQAIFATGLVRTQQTAKPLARKLGLKANTVEECAGQRAAQEGSSPSGSQMRRVISKGGGNSSLAGEGG